MTTRTRRKSPISVDGIQFYTYGYDQVDELVFINQFPYDDRNDFIADRFLGGIAVKLQFSNNRYDRGARRNILLTLVDVTARCEVTSQNVKVNIRKNESFKEDYAYFSTEAADIKPGHTYKLVISDSTTPETLTERVFHLFDKDALPHPSQWYAIHEGGVRPAWENELYKTIKTIDHHDYYVRFNLAQKFGSKPPTILPELELRLYYPDGRHIATHFREPMCHGMEDYKDNLWFVEYPFTTSDDNNGVFYAELLCMEYPIAGFAFDTNASNERGKWFGPDIEPLDKYSTEAAIERWITLLTRSEESSTHLESDDFDKLLDKFIADEMANCNS